MPAFFHVYLISKDINPIYADIARNLFKSLNLLNYF